jgi:ComF family protein
MWNVARSFVSLLFPACCAACGAECVEGQAFCGACALSVDSLPGLGESLPRPPGVVRARAMFGFGGALARAVRIFKLAPRPELAGPLGALLPFARAELIVPVPLHGKRLRARQFNQSAALAFAGRDARRLAGTIDTAALVRVRDTPSQATLPAAERRRNVLGAFRADPRRVRGRRVLLVDDVLTTGATAEACARALGEAGAAEVAVLTLARALP